MAEQQLPEPTWPKLAARVHQHRAGTMKQIDVILELPRAANVCDSHVDVWAVPGQVGKEEKPNVLLVHFPLAELVWEVALPFLVDVDGCDAPSIAKLRKRRRTVTVKGLKERCERPAAAWIRPLLVRSLSGKVVHALESADDSTQVSDIVTSVCEHIETRGDEVKLMLEDNVLQHDRSLGECLQAPGKEEALELSLAVVQGPPVTARSTSGRRIEVLPGVPQPDDDCHFDRDYVFISLGGFSKRRGMRYVMASNDDRKTSIDQVMWQLDIREPMTVYLNFRSENHVQNTGVLTWLNRYGWQEKPDFDSAVTSGYPNGPYSGPVYAKSIRPKNRQHLLNLMGSNCWEGTYFVFVELESVN
eukprot:TRINITY_DN62492_c0_g1_i1.p1 TRINITY_DN62492_c0_g1~~TRINITY_DN62492_c0_g1_i1.p1  ORF type:complete len:359 (+),score=55.16 TRINITY_DN62492_c0_g1_i1:65-1141(+)